MGKLNSLFSGAVVGAGAMYFFDPQLGRRRRTLLEDQFRRFGRQASEGLDAAIRDLSNRAQGTVAEVQNMFSPHDISDDVLCERIRSLAGRYVTNASALTVDVADGCVCLSGPVLADEAGPLVHAVRCARGVRSVHNQLDVHDSRGNVSSLQGQGRRSGELPELLQANWAPGTRLVAGAAGTLLMMNCMLNRGLGSMLWGTLGFGLVARAIANPITMGPRRSRGRSLAGDRRAESEHSAHLGTRQRQVAPPTPWPPSTSAQGDSTGRMSSGNEDRPDIWPASKAASAQTELPGPAPGL